MGNRASDSSSGRVAERKRHSFLVNFLIRLVKEHPLGTVGAIITLLLLLIGIFANFLAPYEMNTVHKGSYLMAPSARFWLGTDNLGRDMLSRVIFGARISVIVGLSGTAIATLIATVIGIVSGYLGGKFDLLVQRFVDAWLCFPGLVVLIIIISVIGPGMVQVIAVLGLVNGIGSSRIIRSATMSIRENVYVEAAVAIGCSPPRILTSHILPNIMAPIITLSTVLVPSIILLEASLSFLGFGIPPPVPSWGGMLTGSARQHMFRAPWIAIWPGLALAVTVYGVNMFGDALRDLLDPRMRGGVGRYGTKVKKEAKKVLGRRGKLVSGKE